MSSNVELEDDALDQFEELIQRVESLEFQLQQVFERNKKVEADKSWELSALRISLIAAITYLVTTVIFYLIGVDRYLLSALIPTAGYLLSTLSLRYVKAKTTPTEQKKTIRIVD